MRTKTGIIAAALVCAALIVTGPVAAPARARSNTTWTVAVHTSGGLAGRGRGAVTISSAGKVTVELPAPHGQQPRRCVSRLSRADLARLRAAVDRAAPAAWAGKTIGPAAADAFEFTLELRTGTGARAASKRAVWYDNTRNELPEGLAALYTAVEAAWRTAEDACPRSGPR